MIETPAEPDAPLARNAGDGTVRTVSRVARVLLVLARAGEAGARVTDIARDLELAKPTVHRLLNALADSGLASYIAPTRRYRIGALAALLGEAGRRSDMSQVCRDSVERIAAQSGDTVYLSVRENMAALCVASATGTFPVRTLTLAVGDFRPLGVGAGSLALLAALPDDEVERCLQQNRQWLERYPRLSELRLRTGVAAARRDGYAANQDGVVEGMSAIGVAVLGSNGEPVAALSIAAISDRLKEPRRAELVRLLQAEAESCRQRLRPASAGLPPVNVAGPSS